ncbi:uncharacterized protein LOC109595598 [Aethina tumida]|uniref:uncharacterized protein LOC109595598 n=1 Tax=Aethina tumida TaxID=116153 RepID=UPI00214930C7|nr:uncharacterized protein LOC109595598 [Aethina tumida]
MQSILVILFYVSVVYSKSIYIVNETPDNLIISATEFGDFLLETKNAINLTVRTDWNGTIFGRYHSCNDTDCKKYVSKAHFTMGYLAENLDLNSVDLRMGFNYPMTINPFPLKCLCGKCDDDFFLSKCDEEDMVIVNNRLVACKNTDNSLSSFNIACGQTAVTYSYNENKNVYKCANVDYYTVTFGKK